MFFLFYLYWTWLQIIEVITNIKPLKLRRRFNSLTHDLQSDSGSGGDVSWQFARRRQRVGGTARIAASV